MISEENKKKIIELWQAREPGLSYPVAKDEEIKDFEECCREIPEDYLWFLKNCGGGVVGSEWVDGIDDLHSTHTKFDDECAIPNGYTIKDSFIVGWDGAGNPMAISPEGKIIVQWHDSGDIEVLSESFENWLLSGLGVDNAANKGN